MGENGSRTLDQGWNSRWKIAIRGGNYGSLASKLNASANHVSPIDPRLCV